MVQKIVSRKPFSWYISLTLKFDTHKNTNLAWHLWIMPVILFTSKADIGKIVLKGSLGKEVTPVFEKIRPKCTAIGHLV
jgi:hypothetical protein